MPKPIPSTYPKEQRWRFIQRSIPDNQLIAFANALVASHNKNLHKSLPDILRFTKPRSNDSKSLNHVWLSIWVNIMHQGGLGYTVTSRANRETRIFATDLSRYIADTKNVPAYYYYWALRFQYPFAVPKHKHYIIKGIAVQPVVLICQHLVELSKMKRNFSEVYLSKFEITEFLMKSTGHTQRFVKSNCTEIIANRKRNYDYSLERQDRGFEEAGNHFFERGHLFIDKIDLLKFKNDRVEVSSVDDLAKLKIFLSYQKEPFVFAENNNQDVRNEFFVEAYNSLDPDPDILYENVNAKVLSPSLTKKKPLVATQQGSVASVINPINTMATFGSATRAERKFQQQLRRDMIAIYNGRCCVCGLDRQEFLVASHIIPVNIDPSIAKDRTNCLLLCVLHDRALEKGYFGLQDDYTIVVNHKKTLRHPVLIRQIVKRANCRIHLPQKYSPSIEFLKRHRVAHGISTDASSSVQTSLG